MYIVVIVDKTKDGETFIYLPYDYRLAFLLSVFTINKT
jgi:hypothetical protein